MTDINPDLSSHVETVCLLESVKGLHHISFSLNMADLRKTVRTSATYNERCD